jgi:hypothetical protein
MSNVFNKEMVRLRSRHRLIRHQSRLPLGNINTLQNSETTSTRAFGILCVHPQASNSSKNHCKQETEKRR